MVKIEMLSDFGEVNEVCDAAVSSAETCEDGVGIDTGYCDGPVYRWVTNDGFEYEACRYHIDADDLSRFAY